MNHKVSGSSSMARVHPGNTFSGWTLPKFAPSERIGVLL
jgi:hypothetical protein